MVYDKRYVNRLADLYLDRLTKVGHDGAKDWLYRTLREDFDLLDVVLETLDTRAKVRGVALI